MSSYFAIFFIIIRIFLRSAHCTCMAASSSFPLEPSLLVPPREPLNSETVWQFSGLRYGTIGTNGTNGLMEVPDISLAFCKEVCFSTELNLGKQPWMTLIVCCIKSRLVHSLVALWTAMNFDRFLLWQELRVTDSVETWDSRTEGTYTNQGAFGLRKVRLQLAVVILIQAHRVAMIFGFVVVQIYSRNKKTILRLVFGFVWISVNFSPIMYNDNSYSNWYLFNLFFFWLLIKLHHLHQSLTCAFSQFISLSPLLHFIC